MSWATACERRESSSFPPRPPAAASTTGETAGSGVSAGDMVAKGSALGLRASPVVPWVLLALAPVVFTPSPLDVVVPRVDGESRKRLRGVATRLVTERMGGEPGLVVAGGEISNVAPPSCCGGVVAGAVAAASLEAGDAAMALDAVMEGAIERGTEEKDGGQRGSGPFQSTACCTDRVKLDIMLGATHERRGRCPARPGGGTRSHARARSLATMRRLYREMRQGRAGGGGAARCPCLCVIRRLVTARDMSSVAAGGVRAGDGDRLIPRQARREMRCRGALRRCGACGLT